MNEDRDIDGFMARLNINALLKRIRLLNANRLAIIIIILCSLVMINYMKGSLYSMWDHTLTPFNPELCVIKDAYVWDYSSVGGQYQVFLAHTPYHVIIHVLSLIFSVNIANTILSWLLFLMCGLSMYVFVMKTLKLNKNVKSYVALIASLVYMFNPFWIFRLSTVFPVIFILAFLPLLMLISREALMSANTSITRTIKYSLLASVMTVPMTPGLSNIPAGLAAGFFVGAYLIFLSIIELKRKLKPLIITLALLVVFLLLVNLWWIFPNLTHSTVQGAMYRSPEYVSSSLDDLEGASAITTYFNVLRGMNYLLPSARNIQESAVSFWTPRILVYHTELFVIISILTPLVALTALLSRRIVKSSEILVFALIAIIFIPLFFTGLSPPSGSLVRWLMTNVPFFVFRRPATYMFLLHFMYAYMFSLGIFALYSLVRKQKFRFIKLSWHGMIACVLIFVIGVNAFPQWLGYTGRMNFYDENSKIQSVSALVREPDYVSDLVNYLNNAPESGGVLILPLGGMIRAYNWDHGYFGWDVYYLSLNRPVLTHNTYGRKPIDYVYDMVNNYMNENGSKFADLLTLLNIKYIIVAEDALRWPPTPLFNIAKIHEFLSKSEDIRFVKRFSKHVLYETTKNPKMFYPVTQSVFPEPRLDQKQVSLNENSWALSPAINMTLTNSLYNLTYAYTEERLQKGFHLARLRNTVPLNLSTLEYTYFCITLRTQPGVGVRMWCGDSAGAGFEPINPNEESSERTWGTCVSTTDYYTFKFDLRCSDRVDYITMALVVLEPERIENYTVTVKDMYFEPDPNPASCITGSSALLWLLNETDPAKIALVNTSKAALSFNESPPVITLDEVNPTSFRVSVSNATTPFLLVSTITYDPDWVAEVDGNQLEHFKVNGMFNGWVLNEIGSFTVKIYYVKQINTQLFIYISSIFIVMACIILLLQSFKPSIRKLAKRVKIQSKKDSNRGEL